MTTAVERDEAGFTIVEIVVAMSIFALIAMGLVGTLASTLKVHALARSRTMAEELATGAMETVRALDYADVGTVSGNPPGTLAASSQVTYSGVVYTTTTDVEYVDDPLPGGFQTYANYKLVSIVVTASNSTKPLARLTTKVAPPRAPDLGKGTIKLRVIDYANNEPVANAIVTLSDGPSSTRTDTTAADGAIVFADLTPTTPSGSTTHYRLAVNAAGFQVLPEDRSPSTASRMTLGSGQVKSTVIRVFRPSTIDVTLVDQNGAPFAAGTPTMVHILSAPRSEAVSTSSSALTVTTLAGEYIVPSLEYTVSAVNGSYFGTAQTKLVPRTYPTDNGQSFEIVMRSYSTATMTLTFREATYPNARIPGLRVQLTGGIGDIALTGTTSTTGTLGVVTFVGPAHASAQYTLTAPAQGVYAAYEVSGAVNGSFSGTYYISRAS